jgi:hypothetical protein
MCGKALKYEVVTSNKKITAANFASATPLSGAPEPATAGTKQTFALPSGAKKYVAIRALGEQGNIGLPALAKN